MMTFMDGCSRLCDVGRGRTGFLRRGHHSGVVLKGKSSHVLTCSVPFWEHGGILPRVSQDT